MPQAKTHFAVKKVGTSFVFLTAEPVLHSTVVDARAEITAHAATQPTGTVYTIFSSVQEVTNTLAIPPVAIV